MYLFVIYAYILTDVQENGVRMQIMGTLHLYVFVCAHMRTWHVCVCVYVCARTHMQHLCLCTRAYVLCVGHIRAVFLCVCV